MGGEVREGHHHAAADLLDPKEVVEKGLLLDFVVHVCRVDGDGLLSFKVEDLAVLRGVFGGEKFESLFAVLFEEFVGQSECVF